MKSPGLVKVFNDWKLLQMNVRSMNDDHEQNSINEIPDDQLYENNLQNQFELKSQFQKSYGMVHEANKNLEHIISILKDCNIPARKREDVSF